MTERTPESSNHMTPHEIEGVPSYLQMAAIEELRTNQYEALNQKLLVHEDWQSFSDADEYELCEKLVEDHLAHAGLTEGDEHYAEAKAFLLSVSVHEVSEYDWRSSRDSDGNQIDSRRHTTYAELENSYRWELPESEASADTDEGSNDEAAEQVTEHIEDERSQELLRDLTSKRDAWSSVSAKRQGRLTSIGIKNRKDAEAEYNKAVQAYVGYELGDLLADQSETDEFKNVAIVQHLFNEQELLRNETRAKLKNTSVNKFVEFMNKGNLPTRIAKGVGIGIGAGFLGTLVAGAVGAGLVAGGVIAGSRFAKGYAVHSKDKIGTKKFEDVVDAERLEDWHSENSDHDSLTVTSDYFSETFESDTKAEQKKRLGAAAVGGLSVAGGALIGYGLHALAEAHDGIDAHLVHGPNWNTGNPFVAPGIDLDLPFWNEHFNLPDVDADVDLPETPDGKIQDFDGDGIPDSIDGDIDSDDVLNIDDTDDYDPNVGYEDESSGNDNKLDWSDFSADAHMVEAGEGWYQTFGELGIPEDKHAELLNDIGPKLKDAGWGYFDTEAGEWRISHQGKLTPDVLKLIAAGAERADYDLTA